jgi:hypothetical protein
MDRFPIAKIKILSVRTESAQQKQPLSSYFMSIDQELSIPVAVFICAEGIADKLQNAVLWCG